MVLIRKNLNQLYVHRQYYDTLIIRILFSVFQTIEYSIEEYHEKISRRIIQGSRSPSNMHRFLPKLKQAARKNSRQPVWIDIKSQSILN